MDDGFVLVLTWFLTEIPAGYMTPGGAACHSWEMLFPTKVSKRDVHVSAAIERQNSISHCRRTLLGSLGVKLCCVRMNLSSLSIYTSEMLEPLMFPVTSSINSGDRATCFTRDITSKNYLFQVLSEYLPSPNSDTVWKWFLSVLKKLVWCYFI